jgi:activator of HSP90 ATPase
MVLHNPNNWHWVNKDVSEWARSWFTENLTKLVVEDGDVKAQVSKIQSMDGDVDVSQRKGKVITIFDVKLVLEYTGTVLPLLAASFIEIPPSVDRVTSYSQDAVRFRSRC